MNRLGRVHLSIAFSVHRQAAGPPSKVYKIHVPSTFAWYLSCPFLASDQEMAMLGVMRILR